MQMVRQNHHGFAVKRSLTPCPGKRPAQQVDVIDKRAMAPMRQCQSEEIRGTFNSEAAIVRHGRTIPHQG